MHDGDTASIEFGMLERENPKWASFLCHMASMNRLRTVIDLHAVHDEQIYLNSFVDLGLDCNLSNSEVDSMYLRRNEIEISDEIDLFQGPSQSYVIGWDVRYSRKVKYICEIREDLFTRRGTPGISQSPY